MPKKISPTIDNIIEQVAAKEGVDPSLVRAIISVESGGDPNAVSKDGATGIMQLMPATAAEHGVKKAELKDPLKNIEAGVKELKKNLIAFDGDETKAIAAYNAGRGAVKKAGGVPNFSETKKFVNRVEASRELTRTLGSGSLPTHKEIDNAFAGGIVTRAAQAKAVSASKPAPVSGGSGNLALQDPSTDAFFPADPSDIAPIQDAGFPTPPPGDPLLRKIKQRAPLPSEQPADPNAPLPPATEAVENLTTNIADQGGSTGVPTSMPDEVPGVPDNFATTEGATAAKQSRASAEAPTETAEGGKESTVAQTPLTAVAPTRDPVINELIAKIFEPRDKAKGPEPLSGGMRFAAGIIAALSPQTYAAVVLPELQRRGATAKSLALLEETARNRDIGALQALASLEAVEANRVAIRGQAAERIDVQNRSLALRQEIAAEKIDQKRRRNAEATQMVDLFSQTLEPLEQQAEPLIAQLIEEGGGDEGSEPHLLAENLSGTLAAAKGLINGFRAAPDNVTQFTPTMLNRSIDRVDKNISKVFALRARQNLQRTRIEASLGAKLIDDQMKFKAQVAKIDTAIALVQDGVGGPFAGKFGGVGPFGAERADLASLFSTINIDFLPEQLGATIPAHEREIAAGIFLEVDGVFNTTMSGLLSLKGIYQRRVRSIDFTYRTLGLRTPDEIAGFAGEADHQTYATSDRFQGVMDGANVYQLGDSPYDLYVEEPD